MEISVFDSFWQSSFYPYVQYLTATYKNCTFDKTAKESIYQEYERLREVAHSYMMDFFGRIDRHKVASLMAFSIIKVSPFSLPDASTVGEIYTIEKLANEMFAFHCALSIVKSFIIAEAEKKGDILKIKIFRNDFLFPECDHSDYQVHFVRNLYYSKINKSLDIFTLANLLFMIEVYTESQRKNNMIIDLDPTKKMY